MSTLWAQQWFSVFIPSKMQFLSPVSVLVLGCMALDAAACESAPSEGEASTAPASAMEYVDYKSQQMLAVIQCEKVHYREDPERFITAIRNELIPLLDMRVAVRRVMGSYYKSATKEQRKRFAEKFRDTLVRSFAKAIAEFDFEGISVTSGNEKKGSRQATVDMEVKTKSGTVTLTYYLYRNKKGAWKLFNMRLEGADLTSTYIGQFSGLMSSYNDIDQVIDRWGG